MSYPEPWRPRSARIHQRSDPGPRGKGTPVPAGRVSTVHYWRSTEGLIWRQCYHNNIKLKGCLCEDASFYRIWIVPSRVLFHFSRCSVHLTGNSQTRNAQSAAGSGGAKTKVDEYTVAEGSAALFTQVRCQTPGILARGQFKMLLQYHNFRKSIPSFS